MPIECTVLLLSWSPSLLWWLSLSLSFVGKREASKSTTRLDSSWSWWMGVGVLRVRGVSKKSFFQIELSGMAHPPTKKHNNFVDPAPPGRWVPPVRLMMRWRWRTVVYVLLAVRRHVEWVCDKWDNVSHRPNEEDSISRHDRSMTMSTTMSTTTMMMMMMKRTRGRPGRPGREPSPRCGSTIQQDPHRFPCPSPMEEVGDLVPTLP